MSKLFIAISLAWACASTPVLAQALPDPTRHPDAPVLTESSAGQSGWTLQGTRIAGTRRSAVINAKTVHEGEHIGSARVLRIRHGQVDLSVAGQRLTLTMFLARSGAPSLIRKSAAVRAEPSQGSHP